MPSVMIRVRKWLFGGLESRLRSYILVQIVASTNLIRKEIMASKEEIVATLEATNTALQGVLERLDTLDADSASVTDELAALRKQVAEGQTPDLSGIEAASAKLTATAASIRTKVGEAAPPPVEPAPEQPAPEEQGEA